MLTEDLKLWHGLAIAVVSLVLQSCLLATVNYLLSRHMAKENERLLKRARLRVPRPSRARRHSPAAQEVKETPVKSDTPVFEPHYKDDSDTSSDSSNASDNSSSSPPTSQDTKDLNYTQVAFSATGRQKIESTPDYENVKEATDYVNVNPKSHKHNLWTFVNPAAPEPVEYTQVAM